MAMSDEMFDGILDHMYDDEPAAGGDDASGDDASDDDDLESDAPDDEDTEDEAIPRTFSFAKDAERGVAPKKVSPATNGGLPNYGLGEFDKSYWKCISVGTGKAFVKMTDTVNGLVYTMSVSRINKALRHLHLPTVAATLRASEGTCRCKRNPKCYMQGQTTHSILAHRLNFFQQLNELDATKYLADLVRPANTCSDKTKSAAKPRFKWVLNGIEMCDDFFWTIFGVSKDKLTGVRRLLDGEGIIPAPRLRPERPRIKYAWCLALWLEFFKVCQRPNASTRLYFLSTPATPQSMRTFSSRARGSKLCFHVPSMTCRVWAGLWWLVTILDSAMSRTARSTIIVDARSVRIFRL
jgi:hypothetical protein